MTEIEAAAVLRALDAMKVPFMLVGSLSSNAYGIERSTKDADLVVQMGDVPFSRLLQHLPEGFRMEPQIGFETITSTTRYRIRYDPLGFVIEFFELSNDAHDQARFSRRLPSTYNGAPAFLPRAEDVVIMKLRWAKVARSRIKDIDDVRNVLAVQQGRLDKENVRKLRFF